jgi:hypothetical protein
MYKIDLYNIDVRILDIFISGPLQIYVSLLLKNKFLKYFIFITGILNIAFNGYVFLLKSKYIRKKHRYLKYLITEDGKRQIHRLYNLTIMYPIFLYILLHCKLPVFIQFAFFSNIVIGFIYNLYNFIILRQKYGLV